MCIWSKVLVHTSVGEAKGSLHTDNIGTYPLPLSFISPQPSFSFLSSSNSISLHFNTTPTEPHNNMSTNYESQQATFDNPGREESVPLQETEVEEYKHYL